MKKNLFDLVNKTVTDEPRFQVPETTSLSQGEFEITSIQPLSNLEQLVYCPRCHKPLAPTQALSGELSTCFMECIACGTLINTFKPLPYQAEFMGHSARYKMAAGGYGSGKTTCDIQYAIKHLLLIPNAAVCVCAATLPQLEATFLKEFKEAMPKKLERSHNETKRFYTFTNGSMFMWRSFDDPNKLKSMNLTLVIIVEASDVPESGFDMMKTRLRSTAALIPALDANGNIITYIDPKTNESRIKYRVDARHILMETNPASNWVKKFLTNSSTVSYFGSAHNEGYKMASVPAKTQYTQVISTDANPYLPETYIEENSIGKTDAWIRQFLYGSFNFNDNLVFPNAGLVIVEPHKLPREFDDYGNRVLFFAIGLDYGISDPTHIVYAAYSTETKKLYVYDELRINNADVRTIAREYRKHTRRNGTNLDGLLMMPRFDGRSYSKRESDLHTIGGAFEAAGLYFEPSFANHEIRIIKLNSLINHNQIEIYSTCEYLVEEILNYGFIIDKKGTVTNKPKDGNDHGITALEFIVVELPHNLQELNVYAYLPTGVKHIHDKSLIPETPVRKKKVYDPLSYGEENDYAYNTSDSDHLAFNVSTVYTGMAPSQVQPNGEAGDDDSYEDTRRVFGAYIPDNSSF